MNEIVFPLNQNAKNESVADLQAALTQFGFEIDADEIKEKWYGKSTATAVRQFQEDNQLGVTGRIAEATAQALNERLRQEPYLVHGRITSQAGESVSGYIVVAVDMDPKGENLLGRPQIIDDDGHYEISYQDSDFRIGGRESGNADIVIRVYDSDTPQEPLHKSRMYANSPRKKQINITIGSSEPIDYEESGSELVQRPIFQKALEQARLHRFGKVIGLPQQKSRNLLDASITIRNINDRKLGALVKSGKLKDIEAKEVGLTVTLFRFLDEDSHLTEAIRLKHFTNLPFKTVESLFDFVKLDQPGWENLLKQVGFKSTEASNIKAYAQFLRKKIENLYPSATLLARLLPSGDEISEVKHHRFPGLKLDNIIHGTQEEIDHEKKSRIELFRRFCDNNPRVEFLKIDYSHASSDVKGLNFDGLDNEQQKMVLATWKGYQRAYRLAEDIDYTQKMLDEGYNSALHVASVPLSRVKKTLGLSLAEAKRIHKRAKATVTRTTQAVLTILDAKSGGLEKTAVGNVDSSIEDYFKQIEGYEELFGSQDYCNCEHCRSILSPAAYFVDLMRFIETHILKEAFGDDPQNDLNLKVRRPDLWNQVKLTCENTNKEIPLLVIVNEIFENYIAKEIVDPDIDISNRVDVEQKVFSSELQKSEFDNGAGRKYASFQLPFNLPQERLQTYLAHFEHSRGGIAELLEEDPAVVSAAYLNLSAEDRQLITESKATDRDYLYALYNIPFEQEDAQTISPFDAQLLLKSVGVSRQELGQLVATRFVGGTNKSLLIQGERRDEESVQNDIERIYGLSYSILDRMHRFVRLWRKLTWSIPELDLVLAQITAVRPPTDIHKEVLNDLVTFLNIQKRFKLSVENTAVFIHQLPQTPLKDGELSLFDRLFNPRDLVRFDEVFPPTPEVNFVHPKFKNPNEEDNPEVASVQSRLLGGLRVDYETLYTLIFHLHDALGGLDYKNGFPLTHESISLLYRHAMLTKLLKLETADLFRLIKYSPEIEGAYIDSIAALAKFLKFYDWWQTSNFSLDQLDLMTGTIRHDPNVLSHETKSQIINQIEEDDALVFPDTVFAHLENIDEAQSRSIIAVNPSLIERFEDSFRLVNTYGLSTELVIPGELYSLDKEEYLNQIKAGVEFVLSAYIEEDEALPFPDTIFASLENIDEAQSRAIIEANPSLIEPFEDSFHLVKIDGLSTELVIPEELYPLDNKYINQIKADVEFVLSAYHAREIVPRYLAHKHDVSVDKMKSMIQLTDSDLSDPDFMKLLKREEPRYYSLAEGWTTAEFYTVNDQSYLFLLRAQGFNNEGKNVVIHKIYENGAIGTTVADYRLAEGWTNAQFFKLENKTYLFLLRKQVSETEDQTVKIFMMNSDGSFDPSAPKFSDTSLVGWTTAEYFTQNNKAYMLLLMESGFNDDSRNVRVFQLNSDGRQGIQFEPVHDYKWPEGLTAAPIVTVGIQTYCFPIKRSGFDVTGNNAYAYPINQDGSIDKIKVESFRLAEGWTTAEFYCLGQNQVYLFLLMKDRVDADEHNVHIYRMYSKTNLQFDGDVYSSLPQRWTTTEFFTVNDRAFRFFLREGDSDDDRSLIHIHEMRSNGTFKSQPFYTTDLDGKWSMARFFQRQGRTFLFLMGTVEGKNYAITFKMNRDGTFNTERPVDTVIWDDEWTTAEFFTMKSQTYLFLLKEFGNDRDGNNSRLYKVNLDGSLLSDHYYSTSLSEGWTEARFIYKADEVYLLLHNKNGDDNNVCIFKLNSSGSIIQEPLYRYSFEAGWTSMQLFSFNQEDYLLFSRESGLDAEGKNVRIYGIRENASIDQDHVVLHETLEVGLKSARVFAVNGRTYLSLNKYIRGGMGVLTHRLTNYETIYPAPFVKYKWTQGWTKAEFFTIEGQTFLLLLKTHGAGADGDNVHVHKIELDGTIGQRVKGDIFERLITKIQDLAGVYDQVFERAGTERALIFHETLFASLGSISETQSRAIIKSNSATIAQSELEPGENWLKDDFDPAKTLRLPAGLNVAEKELRATLLKHHVTELLPTYLANVFNISVEKLKLLVKMTEVDLTDAEFTQMLKSKRGATADKLISLTKRLRPLTAMFETKSFTVEDLEFIFSNRTLFKDLDFAKIGIDQIKNLTTYREFINNSEMETSRVDLKNLLGTFHKEDKFKNSDQDILARLLDIEIGLETSLQQNNLNLSENALDALDKLQRCAEVAKYIGIGGENLKQIVSEQYDDLDLASQALLGAFRAKYEDEKTWQETIEPFEQTILGRKRNALTAYLLDVAFPQKWQENPELDPTHRWTTTDLYNYFLLDPEVEGCFPTSRIVAAISSLQLYVHRVLMNLEQNEKGDLLVQPNPEDEFRNQWEWRKHYRVWEANRKVFLWPENYLLPNLRHNKTPLFKELESELLQQEITEQTVLDAYGKYLQGFTEVAHLSIAGAYHDIGDESDILHLFGVTHGDPSQYYYRTVENLYHSVGNESKNLVWNPWVKIDVKVPVRKVAPIVYNGRLYIFWVEIRTTSHNTVVAGDSVFSGYSHKILLNQASLKLDGSWTVPQKISLFGPKPFLESDGIIDDPLRTKEEEKELHDKESDAEIKLYLPFIGYVSYPGWSEELEATQQQLLTPRYSNQMHTKANDAYTLKGFHWEEVFPTINNEGKLIIYGAGFQMITEIDLFRNSAVGNLGQQIISTKDYTFRGKLNENPPETILTSQGSNLYSSEPPTTVAFDNYAYCSTVIEEDRIKKTTDFLVEDSSWYSRIADFDRGSQIAILHGTTKLTIVNASPQINVSSQNAILETDKDQLFLQGSVLDDHKYLLRRIGTNLSEDISNLLFKKGINGLLNTRTQVDLKEDRPDLGITIEFESHSDINIASGWSNIEIFTIKKRTFLLLHRADNFDEDKNIRIHRITESGEIDIDHEVASYSISEGWTTAKIFSVNSQTYLLLLRKSGFDLDGKNIHIYKINDDGTIDFDTKYAYAYSEGITDSKVFVAHGRTFLFLAIGIDYSDARECKLFFINEDGSIGDAAKNGSDRLSGKWATQAFVFYSIYDKTYLFHLNKEYTHHPVDYCIYEIDYQWNFNQFDLIDAELGWGEERLIEFYEVNSIGCLFLLKNFPSEGVVEIMDITDDGIPRAILGEIPTDQQWTYLKPFNVENRNYLLLINQNDGSAKIYKLREPHVKDKVNSRKLDFTGAFGIYYREIFFHIPFLIAHHLNGQGKFEEAQKYYHYIFNPTANEIITNGHKRDRNWRYLEFRGLDILTLQTMLNNKDTIGEYESDPFNAHAIARLRLAAYQKNVVMSYIDNLLDWADELFSKFQMETINKATMLYLTAKDILGQRPAELGDCSQDENNENITYDDIVQWTDSPFLIEMEHETINQSGNYEGHHDAPQYIIDRPVMRSVATRANKILARGGDGHTIKVEYPASFEDKLFLGTKWQQGSLQSPKVEWAPVAGYSITQQASTLFCVPENKDLKQYWDRVEDRLFKIRNCQDITGKRRSLSLFAPEIDPGMLVRAKAAGLSIDDVLDSLSGTVAPYRFTYIIEKAKAMAGTVQSFGSALLSALEKKDAEELTLLRSAHEQNILEMMKKTKEQQIEESEAQFDSLQETKLNIELRRDYYKGLIEEGRIPFEVHQSINQHLANGLRILEGSLLTLGSIYYLVPSVGSPFAMKYGGKESGDSGTTWADVFGSFARLHETVASSLGLEANFARREEEWNFQFSAATQELKQIEKQILAAEMRVAIAERDLELHEKNIEQAQELEEFYKGKFTELGLYSYFSTTLTRLHRQAYNNALAVAKLAEQAYRFERGDDAGWFLESNYWESSKSGLLAGERLLNSLQNMERKFLETNYRQAEVTQSFSLYQIDPVELLTLRAEGSCEFKIPEFYFDLFYPGQYRRRIKSVRLTIPAVTGPYTNVSATLRLKESEIRKVADIDPAQLVIVPTSGTTTVATSSAQNDGGVFEMNFRDERYLPFEGNGAISTWELALPKSFKPFDYQTISDVILHISYKAEYDPSYRGKVEEEMGKIETALADSNKPMHRLFSLRNEFPNEYRQLVNGAVDKLPIKFEGKHFPIFIPFDRLEVAGGTVWMQTKGKIAKTTTVSIDDSQNGNSLKSISLSGSLNNDGQEIKNVFVIVDYQLT